MKIAKVAIRNFRGIRELDWCPDSSLTCVVGPGDVGKTTLLDAIEFALTSRYVKFFDTDFFDCDISNKFSIEVTIGDLLDELLTEGKFGLFKRGFDLEKKEITDEPQESAEDYLTIQLNVDETLQPEWLVVNDRDSTVISQRDRSKLGVIRLGSYADYHLTWGASSHLASLTRDHISGEIQQYLVKAMRAASDQLQENNFEDLINSISNAKLMQRNWV